MKINSLFLAGLVACSVLLHGHNARASLLVTPMAADINSEQDAATSLHVYSRSADIQYVRTRVVHILHPGMPDEKEVQAGDADTGLVVSPDKFALPAGVQRTVRVISTQAPEKAEAWRVYFEAVPAPYDTPENNSPHASSVSVNLIWGVLLRLSPADPQPAIALSADGHHLLNTGNTRLVITRAGVCQPGCQWQAINKSLYPDGSLSLPSGIGGGSVRVKYHTGTDTPEISADLVSARQ